MRLVFLTADDPVYLPAFFDRVLAAYAAETDSVVSVPALYKGQTRTAAALRYYRTFGLRATLQLVREVGLAKAQRRSVRRSCQLHGVAHRVADDVNAPGFVDWIEALRPDLVISVSCPQIFRSRLLNAPAMGCLNLHGAILPKYRGVMPSFWMLANGERQAGVTIYFMNDEIDAGDVCRQRVFDIVPDESLDEFLRRSKRIAADLLVETLDAIAAGTLRREPMDLSAGSYYSWPDRDAVQRFRAAGRRLR
jgi:methionyl-tRNA formyltransferase